MNTYDLHDEVDAVVIGTGAGGSPLLYRLAAAGLKVVAIEAGQSFDATTDFATDEVSQAKIFWMDERLSAGKDPLAFGNNNSGCGVGGSTLHYTAYTPRPHPDEFHLHDDFGKGKNWPLAFADLEDYYAEVEQFIGVSGPSSYPWGAPRKTPYPLPPLPLNAAAEFMKEGCAKMGIQTSPAANAALSARHFQPGYGWRPACTNRGYCQAGCSTGAKSSMDVTYLPAAISAGAEIRSESFVTTFEKKADGRISAVVYTRKGKEYRQKCRNVFLCAGAIETPRLLLMNGMSNSSGQVGKNFLTHTGVQVWGEFEETTNPYKGIPGSLISEDFHRPENVSFAGGFLLQSIGVMPVTYASQLVRGRGLWGNALKQRMAAYTHVAGINILGECLPYDNNYLELSDELDERGLPKPRIYFTNGKNENDLSDYAEKLMRDIWKQAGAKEIWTFKRNPHIMGTCRMGNDSHDAVVDSNGKSFDVPNLYISDNSIFPSSLSANPALTIMALSLRIADNFLQEQTGSTKQYSGQTVN